MFKMHVFTEAEKKDYGAQLGSTQGDAVMDSLDSLDGLDELDELDELDGLNKRLVSALHQAIRTGCKSTVVFI